MGFPEGRGHLDLGPPRATYWGYLGLPPRLRQEPLDKQEPQRQREKAEMQDEPRFRCFQSFHASLAFSVFVVVLKFLEIFISLFSLRTRFSHVSLFLLLRAFLELLLFALSRPP